MYITLSLIAKTALAWQVWMMAQGCAKLPEDHRPAPGMRAN
jgi:hypothetical protein